MYLIKKIYSALFLLTAFKAAIPNSIASPVAEKKTTPGAVPAKENPLQAANKMLNAAKLNCDDAGMAHAYKAIMYLSPPSKMMAYADSLVASAERTGKDIEIGSAYLTKGALHYSKKELEKALDCFLVADPHLKKTGDIYLKYKLKYSLAITRHELGYYDDAISSFRECAQYFEEENDQAYLNSMHFLSLAYLRHGLYALSKNTADSGLSASKSLDIPEMEHYFRQVLGANMYYDKNYSGAVAALKKELAFFQEKGDYANESASCFYIGSSLWELGDKDGGITYLEEVDRIFSSNNYIRPELIHAYTVLIDYYTEKGDHKKISKYARMLDSADIVIHREFKHLASTVYTKYDAAQRKELIHKNDSYLRYFKIAVPIILATVPILAFVIAKIMRRFSRGHDKSFQNVIEMLEQPANEIIGDTKDDYPSEEKENDILSKINIAIKEWVIFKKSLTKDEFMKITGIDNEKAFLQVLKRHMGMNYILFFHTVRIMHLLSELKKDPSLFEKNLNDGLATHCGYENGRAFSDGMYMVLKMRPKKFLPRYMKYLAAPESESRSIQDVIQEIKEDLKDGNDTAGI